MASRIDHATVITPQDERIVVLENHSVTFADGVITAVLPTPDVAAALSDADAAALSGLRGRPLGRILLRMNRVTERQIVEALERQRERPLGIGQTLVNLGYVQEADVQIALDIQAGRWPEQVIDGRDRLLIPGLVNTHHHLFQSLTRCAPSVQNATLFEWLTTLYPVWQALDHETLRQAAMVSLAELLLGGCTTTSDHMYLFPADGDVKLEAVLEAADTLGIRIHACRGSMSMGQSAGGLPPDACTQDEDTILADCRRVIDAYHDPSPLAMRRIDLAPCAPFSITPELFVRTRELAAERGVLLHTHAAETLDEERFCRERYGMRPIAYLREHGWLGPDVYLAHCVHLDEGDIRMLADSGTGVAHCPCSNMRLGSGIAPLRAMLDAGVKVGLGVDGSSSNDGGNLLAEARQALLLQRVGGNVRGLTPAEAFRIATVGGADVLNRTALGRIEPGAAADLVMVDANDVAFAGALAQDPLGALMLCHAPRPDRVIIDGHTVVEHGTLTRIDARQLAADFNRLVAERFRVASA